MKRYCLLTLLTLLNGCASQHLSLTTLYESSQCGTKEPGISILENQTQLDYIVNHQASLTFGSKKIDTPKINKNNNTILIAMGLKPSAGYSLYLYENSATVNNNTLTIPIEFKEVPPGGIAATVITTPCMILSVEKEKYHSIKAGNYVKKI